MWILRAMLINASHKSFSNKCGNFDYSLTCTCQQVYGPTAVSHTRRRPSHAKCPACMLQLELTGSVQECARYLETLKAFEAKGAAGIQGRTEEDYLSRLHGAFGAVRGISRTNALTLGRGFGTAAGIMQVIHANL